MPRHSRLAKLRKTVLDGFEFEDLVTALFKAIGYQVEQHAEIGRMSVDLLASKDGARHPVEASMVTRHMAMAKLRTIADRLKPLQAIESGFSKPIVVIGDRLTIEAKSWFQDEYGMDVWDLSDLEAKARPHHAISARLSKLFKKDERPEESETRDGEVEDLKRQLLGHISGNALSATEYERLCMAVFIALFDPHLYGFEKQAKTTDGANRYDFICRILPGNDFWDAIRQDFRTRAVLFECKNYAEEIGPDQVYSTERYLFAGGLRTVCLLVSRLGANAAAIRAAQGAMRESGKLLILLSNQDLVEMLNLKTQDGGPENFLDKRIWDFIISLPR